MAWLLRPSWVYESEMGNRATRSRVLVALAAALALAALSPTAQAFSLPVTGPPGAPQMVFNKNMKVVSVCLPVTNPAGGRSLLYGAALHGRGGEPADARDRARARDRLLD